MTIGGIDITLEVPRGVAVHQRIIDQVLRFWPDARFQDVESEDDGSLADAGVRLKARDSREFFIYRDRAAAESWRRDGASAATWGTMLQFLVDEGLEETTGRGRVTIVCDERTEPVEQVIRALKGGGGDGGLYPAATDVQSDSAPANR
jgi:hypothetical protein